MKSVYDLFLEEHDKQHDAHEFLIQLLDKLEKPLPDLHNEYTVTTDFFYECQECGDQRYSKTASDNIINLHLSQDDTNIQTLVDMHCQSEEAVDAICDNMCTSRSGFSKILKKQKVMNPPNVIFFLLMRYHNPMHKLHNSVNPSININFHGSTYKLKSIVQHDGPTQRRGHYTTMLHLDNNK